MNDPIQQEIEAKGLHAPRVTPADIEFAHRWLEMRKVVFSSTVTQVDWNTRVFTGDALTDGYLLSEAISARGADAFDTDTRAVDAWAGAVTALRSV